MSPENILGTAFAAMLNSLWQSAAMALLAWAALRFLPRVGVMVNAATRCAVWWAVLAATILLPMAPQAGKSLKTPAATPTIALAQAPAAPAQAILTPTETPLPARESGPLQMTAGAGLLAIFALWSALSIFRIAQIVRSYRYLRGIKQRSRAVSPEQRLNFDYWLLACGIDRTTRLLASGEIVSPMAVGFRRPAVIVPETLLNEFTEEELDHVILHELAHIARYDDWTNLFARVIGALLPVHPVAVWLLKQIEQDREIACDDWVVAMTGEARPYAASLTRLFELCSARRRQLLATGMADRASHLGERIEALLRSGRDFAPRVSLVRVALGAAILVGLVFAGARAPHWIAFAQEPAAPVAPVPPAPPAPPAAPAPPTAPRPAAPAAVPEPPEPLVAVNLLDDDTRAEIQETTQFLREELRQLDAQFREQSQNLTQNHPDQRRLTAEIAALQAQLARANAVQAQVQAQQEAQANEQRRAASSTGGFLAALVAAGYGNLSVDEIIEIRNSGVSPEFLRSVSDSGLKPSAKELVELARSGVSGQYLRALRDTGFKDLGVPDIIEAARSGVRPELIRALKDAFPQITMRQIVDAAHSGLNAGDLRQAREYGPNLTLEQIIKLKHAGVI